MRIDRIVIYEARLPLLQPFETSIGRTTVRRLLLVEAVGDGVSGWGEATVDEDPFYNEEWTESAWLILRDYAAPRVLEHPPASAADAWQCFTAIRGHRMACGGLEAAIWDLEARMLSKPLWEHIGGGARSEIPSGISIGLQDSIPALLEQVERAVTARYQRIKIKIKPGKDVELVRAVRARFAGIPLSVDANGAYTLADAGTFTSLERYRLMMIEQPLAHDDLLDHARLQQRLEVPICLDESIRSARHAEQAIAIGACRIINVKLGRVGGFREALRIHRIALADKIPLWCGGMLESGVGRAHNIALSSLPGFILPGDVSASNRYWKRDIVAPDIRLTDHGSIRLPAGAGFGFELDREYLAAVTFRRQVVRRPGLSPKSPMGEYSNH